MIFRNKFLAVLVFAFAVSSCSSNQKSERENLSEIYSDTMAYEFSYGSRGNIDYCKNGPLTISSLTENYPFEEDDWESRKRVFPELEQKTWENFLQVNSQPMLFPSDLDLKCEYALLDVKENLPDWSRENCIDINYFSQIGFNSHKTQALVYRGASCGDFAYGNLYFAELIDDHWVVTDMAELFIT